METLYEKIIRLCPDLDIENFINGDIVLQNDSDEKGDYIAKWDIDISLPDGLKLGK